MNYVAKALLLQELTANILPQHVCRYIQAYENERAAEPTQLSQWLRHAGRRIVVLPDDSHLKKDKSC